jgi:hypothetical protein
MTYFSEKYLIKLSALRNIPYNKIVEIVNYIEQITSIEHSVLECERLLDKHFTDPIDKRVAIAEFYKLQGWMQMALWYTRKKEEKEQHTMSLLEEQSGGYSVH